jgi:hypothetical protein
MGLALSACGESNFAVGDCVTIDQRVTDQELKAADCPESAGEANPLADPANATYSVDEVLDGADASCDTLHGFLPVEFSDEPADKTYCLSAADDF